ncbi:Hypothetical predicted protein [Olea europaea subsp. europaea]|uniref:Thioredoxin domain-containing protein n=1 Tax=Olea europaea subsp. europaea TaxID=158383 RepID=A0A8S0SGN4_OLEEU|nr:Hypothetical predicted protein [Olea europaea subsp. europaea]
MKAYVGDKLTWRNPQHPRRIESRFKLKGVPTLILWEDGVIKGRLEDHEAHLEDKIDALLSGKNQNHSRSQNRNLNANSNPNPEEDFNLRETLPALGGGRVSSNEQVGTAFDLVKEMDCLYVMVVKAKEFFAKGWEWQSEPL